MHEQVLASMAELAAKMRLSSVHLTMPPRSMGAMGTRYVELVRRKALVAEIPFNQNFANPTGVMQGGFVCAAFDEVFGPLTYMVSGRVWNYEGDFAVMGDNEVPAYDIDEPWQTPTSIFGDTWGYRSWESATMCRARSSKTSPALSRSSAAGNYILNIGPEGDGSVVPYEAEVLRGVGAWV